MEKIYFLLSWVGPEDFGGGWEEIQDERLFSKEDLLSSNFSLIHLVTEYGDSRKIHNKDGGEFNEEPIPQGDQFKIFHLTFRDEYVTNFIPYHETEGTPEEIEMCKYLNERLKQKKIHYTYIP